MLSLKHPSHFTCSTIINTCSVYPSSPQKDVTVFHSVSLGWLVTSMSIWSQYQYMFCLCPPPPPPSSYNGARPPAPKLNRLPACFPIYVYICIYPVPYTWQTQSLITESIYVSGLVLIYFYWCIDISMCIHYATLRCTPQIWTNEHDPFSSSIYTPTNRIQMFIIGCCGGPFP